MKNLYIFIEQISKSVLPYHYNNIINSSYLKLFRFIACIAIVLLFTSKSLMSSSFMYLLLFISYSYILYQCVIIVIRIYYTYKTVIKNNKIISKNKIIPHIRIIYNILILLIVIMGLPVITDTLLEIAGDIKYIVKQFLDKKDK